MAGRIFISYSKADPEPTRALADFLTAQGYSVWWDTNLTSGEVFREVIDRELAAADAVIVIWSAHSVASNWVVSEADDAARRGKLITLRNSDLEPWRIPKPYNTYHADPVENRQAVLAAVRRLAGGANTEVKHYAAKPTPQRQATRLVDGPVSFGSFITSFVGLSSALFYVADIKMGDLPAMFGGLAFSAITLLEMFVAIGVGGSILEGLRGAKWFQEKDAAILFIIATLLPALNLWGFFEENHIHLMNMSPNISGPISGIAIFLISFLIGRLFA